MNVTGGRRAWPMALRALLTFLLLVAAWGLHWLSIDNGIERWVENEVDADRYARFCADFGSDSDVLLVYGGHDLFTEEALDLQLQVLEQIEAVQGVGGVRSLPSLFRDHFGAESAEELEAEVRSSPFYDRLIVSPDLALGGMIISRDLASGVVDRRNWLDELAAAAESLRQAGWSVHWAGPDVVNVTLDRTSEREVRRLLPLAVVASATVLLLLLRSWRKMVAASVVSLLTVLTSLGIMGWFGLSMNLVTVALPPVLWVLSAAYMVHLLGYHEAALRDGATAEEAMRTALRRSVRPCVLAALTTALGFLSLCTAQMAPVRELGVGGAVGILIALLVALGLGPVFIRILRIGVPGGPERSCNRDGGPAPLYAQHPYWVTLGALIVTAVSLGFATRVRVESNPLTFVSARTPLVENAEFVADNFSGLYALETVLQLPGSWLDAENWPAIEAQTASLSREPGVARVASPLDYLRKLRQWDEGGATASYRLPDNGDAARALIASMPDTALSPLNALVSPDGSRVRFSSLVREMDGAALLEIVRRSEASLAGAPRGVTGYHTGIVLRLVRAQFGLIDTQMDSLGLALVMVFLCIGAGSRSLRVLLYAIAPNVLPIAALFGLMGVFDIPLDPATVMVAAIAVGLAVDDTLHLLSSWEEERRTGTDSFAALRKAFDLNRPAIIATTLTASAGFITLGFSEFAPIRYFGLLSAATLAIAPVFDLILLPATIVLGERLYRGTVS